MESESRLGTVNYRGKEFPVVRSSIILEGDREPKLGITLETMLLRCPMRPQKAWSWRRVCDRWIHILLEFTPSAWSCPACTGLIILDWRSGESYHQLSRHRLDLSRERSLYFYPHAQMHEHDERVKSWLQQRLGMHRFQATEYDKESQEFFNRIAEHKGLGGPVYMTIPQFYALESLGLAALDSTLRTRPKIVEVAQLDYLINIGAYAVSPISLSSSMRRCNDLYQNATVAVEEGRLDFAITAYLRLVSEFPDFVAPRVNLANCLLYTGQPVEALQHLEIAHRLAPQDPDIHLAAGRAFEAMGDKETELQQYHEAIEDDPSHVGTMSNLGITYREIGELEKSLYWLQRALLGIQLQEMQTMATGRLGPEKANVYLAMGETHAARGNWHDALICWEGARGLLPPSPRLEEFIRHARRMSGRR